MNTEQSIICENCQRDFKEEVDDRSSFDEILPPYRKIICMDCWEEEEEWEYSNCGIEKEPRFGERSYMVAGGGMGNGNAYATIELKDGLYYYCEYGNYPKRQCVGNKIVWSDHIYDIKDPYCMREFSILDVEE